MDRPSVWNEDQRINNFLNKIANIKTL